MVMLLLDNGAAVDEAYLDSSLTPLKHAALKGYSMIVLLLLNKGANVNYTPLQSNGRTPLHMACLNGRIDAAMLLLDNGADTELMCHRGQTPKELAASQEHLDLVALFEKV